MTIEKIQPKRVLSIFSLVMINVIAVGTLRSLPVNAQYGFSLVFYYLLTGVFFLVPTILATAELATTWPNTGGIYVWVREAFGTKWGFLIIWLQWIYNITWYPTILSFVAGTLAYMIDPHLSHHLGFMLISTLGFFWVSTLINCFGMRLSSWVSSACAIIGNIVPMLIIIGLGFAYCFSHHVNQLDISWKGLFPNLDNFGDLSFLTTVFFSLVGFEMSAVHAEEVRNPSRDFPRALGYSAFLILILLLLSSLAVAAIIPSKRIDIITGLMESFFSFLSVYHMTYLLPVLGGMIIIGSFGGVAAWIIGPTKGVLAAAQDGVFPNYFSHRNTHGVPIRLLLLQGAIFTLLCTVFLIFPSINTSYWILSVMTTQLSLLVYISMFAALIKLRISQPEKVRPFKVPGGKVGTAFLSLFGIFSCVFTIAIGFVPPDNFALGNLYTYELILLSGMFIFTMLPLVFFYKKFLNSPQSSFLTKEN